MWHHFMHANFLFQSSFSLYLLASILFVVWLIKRQEAIEMVALAVLSFAFISNTGLLLHLWFAAGRPPFKTLYETMIFYPWCVSLVFFALYAIHKLTLFGIFSSSMSFAGFVYAAGKPDIEIVNMPPALQSGWFVPHVVTYFIAYGALFASFAFAMLYLAKPAWQHEGRKAGFDKFANDSLDFGFVTLTFGLAMGAIWGKVAWGDYWTWDPKENWALVSWLTYLVAIHLRFVKDWRGKRAAFVSIAGFLAVIFTYLGMHLLPTAESSLHVYQ